MTAFTVAAVQAAYVLMDRDATIDRVAALTGEAAANGAKLVVFPEAFVPGDPIWKDAGIIWDGDEAWYSMLVDQAIVVPSEATERLGAIAREHAVTLVVGIDEREPNGATIYCSMLYFGSDGSLLGKHRKLMPTGSERTVWGMGDGSLLTVVDTEIGRVGGLICWENYMPLARYYMYSQGIDVWVAPTLATGDAWVATMRHIAREGRLYVIGVNPCVRVDQIPEDFPARDKVWKLEDDPDERDWVSPGNSVIIGPTGKMLAGPSRHEETILYADIDPSEVRAARRYFDPTGHYNRPDVFRLSVDTRPRPAVSQVVGALDPD
ncbi:MAG TPA: carbon-nitrogen hydrolase family protein [Candidatus Limnocylindrales bacterium]